MNCTNRSTLAIRHALSIAFAGLLFSTLAPAAFAADSDAPSVKVRYGDLNLATEAGVQTLYRRIKGAARMVCDQSIPSGDAQSVSHFWKCYDTALGNAINRVNNTQLTAMHQQNSRRRAG